MTGPDVHDVVRLLRSVQSEGGTGVEAVDVVAEVAAASGLTPSQVRQVVAYYADHRVEVDERIAADDVAAAEMEASWRRQQDVLAGTGH